MTNENPLRSGESAWRADRARYPRNAWRREPSLWAVASFRFGQWARHAPWWIGAPARALDALWGLPVELLTGITLPREARIGGGLRVWHHGGIVVHARARIGRHCTLRHGVTIGSRHDGGPAPVLGDGVDVGCGACILGEVRVGDGATIGANAVVLSDVPAGAVAVGVPAKIRLPRHAVDGAPTGQAFPAPSPGGTSPVVTARDHGREGAA